MKEPALREGKIKSIQDAVAQMFSLSVEDLKTESRSRDIAFPRQIAIYLSKQMTDASLYEIGQEFGGKHHTSVMHSIAKIHQLRATDVGMNKVIETLLEKLHEQTGG
ncbi:MAG: chromosomal replication initiator protein [Acidobacteriaceae bacterium]|jgi:chromosomal replication initiator protein|nr:chromosomal replication initiator protein [Acidobacteriaceae bacterium]MDX6463726.1 chromosomal replication initiator protein [Acidobacteriaceae bacterium]